MGGGKLLDQGLGKVFDKTAAPKSSITGTLAGAALTRIATKSVPGAIIVGGGMLAKVLFDRRHTGKAVPKDDNDPA
jgi:hypothetical protein